MGQLDNDTLEKLKAKFAAEGKAIKVVPMGRRAMRRSMMKALCRGEITLDGLRRGEQPKPVAAEL